MPIRSQFLTASDVITAKKRQIVAKSYFADIQTSRNLIQKYASLVPMARASDVTRYSDEYYDKVGAPADSVNRLLGCCIPSIVTVSRPPQYVRPNPSRLEPTP